MKITNILLTVILTALSTINVSAQLLNNYCDASFQYNIDSTTCTLTANATYVYPDLTYTWFVGGETFTGDSVSYSFDYSNLYDVVALQVSDNAGACYNSNQVSVDITCAPHSCVGTSAYTISVDSSNCAVTFTPSVIQPSLIYSWYFGDGAYILDSLGAAITHSYLFNTSYTITLVTSPASYYCQDFTEHVLNMTCLPASSTAAITIQEDSANCETTFSVVNPNSSLYYSWTISNSANYTYAGPTANVSFYVGGNLAHVNLTAQDTVTHYYYNLLDTTFLPSCGTFANCFLDASFTYTFDSTTCTYTFAPSNPVADVTYAWNIAGQQLVGTTVTYQPTYDNGLFNATLYASQPVPNTHYSCSNSESVDINATCSLYGPCNLDAAYTITYDSNTCTYTFTVDNPSSSPNVLYQWNIGHYTFAGTQFQYSFPLANHVYHCGLNVYTSDYICTAYAGFIFSPECGTLGDCSSDVLSFTASSSSDTCETTITLTQPVSSNTTYYWSVPTTNISQGGFIQSDSSTTVTFPTPYFGVYPISFYAVTPEGCTLDTTLYFNATCGAMPRACYTEPTMQVDVSNYMTMWFTIPNLRAENTYHWDFGDGEGMTLDPALHYFGMTHHYNAPGIYQATLTVTGPTCNSSFERTINIGTTTGTETANTAESQFTLFPNPTSDVLNLQLSNTINTALILEIFNTQGQRVLSQSINATLSSIDVSTFSAGLYTLRVVDNNSAVIGTKRFVVGK